MRDLIKTFTLAIKVLIYIMSKIVIVVRFWYISHFGYKRYTL